jgi:hypothetical protein
MRSLLAVHCVFQLDHVAGQAVPTPKRVGKSVMPLFVWLLYDQIISHFSAEAVAASARPEW